VDDRPPVVAPVAGGVALGLGEQPALMVEAGGPVVDLSCDGSGTTAESTVIDMRQRFVAVAAALVVGLTGLTAVHEASAGPAPVAAVADPVTLRIGTWNICGEYTGCPNVTAFQTKANMVYSLIRANNLHAIMLSEVCEWHVSEILRQVRLVDPSWQAHFAPVRQIDTAHGWIARRTRLCDRPEWSSVTSDKQVLGIAVLSNGGFDEPTTYELPSPTDVEYLPDNPMACVRKLSPAVRLCEAHLTAPGAAGSETWRRSQVARMQTIVQSFGAERVVIGGDFNTLPPDAGGGTVLAPIYGIMRECAQTGTRAGGATARWDGGSGKIDYLFARSQNTFGAELVSACPWQAPTAAATPNSDHAPVVATLQL
jgi:endonuclease/exonuclease/phosphatase family metal-dependent hydrolase